MLTSQRVRDFWLHMQNEFGSSVVQKDESAVMKAAASLLDVLDIQDKEQFMKDFVTTLHRTIYIPFIVGVEGSGGHWSLWSQIRVCVHENQHVVQSDRDGLPEFAARYLTSSSFRAGYEAEAYGCDLEMEFWRQGANFNPYDFALQRAQGLKSYGCSEGDIDQAATMLALRAGVVVQGVVETKSSQVAIEWLENNVPGLRSV